MIKINRNFVDTLSKQQNSKQTNGYSDSVLYPLFSHAHTNFTDTLRNLSTYEMAHWINYSDRWLATRTAKNNTLGYKRGTILFVDLGSANFGHEPSFTHPVIVLAQTKESILIVPCSSKKYGKGFPEIIDATPNDGFSANTGIQTRSLRYKKLSEKEVQIQKYEAENNFLKDYIASLETKLSNINNTTEV